MKKQNLGDVLQLSEFESDAKAAKENRDERAGVTEGYQAKVV